MDRINDSHLKELVITNSIPSTENAAKSSKLKVYSFSLLFSSPLSPLSPLPLAPLFHSPRPRPSLLHEPNLFVKLAFLVRRYLCKSTSLIFFYLFYISFCFYLSLIYAIYTEEPSLLRQCNSFMMLATPLSLLTLRHTLPSPASLPLLLSSSFVFIFFLLFSLLPLYHSYSTRSTFEARALSDPRSRLPLSLALFVLYFTSLDSRRTGFLLPLYLSSLPLIFLSLPLTSHLPYSFIMNLRGNEALLLLFAEAIRRTSTFSLLPSPSPLTLSPSLSSHSPPLFSLLLSPPLLGDQHC